MKKEKATFKESSPKQTRAHSNQLDLGKERGMLLRFATGESHHRFSAERLGDHCLPTTISDLQTRYGLFFSRKRINVPNRFGSSTSVMRYWLDDIHLEKARRILGLDEVSA
jgi:hypothetical protein